MSVSIVDRRDYQRSERELLAACGVTFDEPACRECGCSDSLGCPDGCWWAQEDLCSACAADLAERSTAAIEGGG